MWKILSVVPFLCGCAVPHTPGRQAARPETYLEAQAAIARGDWDDAYVRLAKFLRDAPESAWALNARYLIGVYYLATKDLDSAQEEFHIVARRAEPRLARQAQIRLADTMRARRDFSEAAELYSSLLATSRRHDDEPELLLKLGLVRQRQGKWNDAEAILGRVVSAYPESPFALRALEQRALPRYFSLQVGAFGEKTNAEQMRRDLASRGHDSSIHAFQKEGRCLWCVRVGIFDSRSQALDFKAGLTQDPLLRYSDVVP